MMRERLDSFLVAARLLGWKINEDAILNSIRCELRRENCIITCWVQYGHKDGRFLNFNGQKLIDKEEYGNGVYTYIEEEIEEKIIKMMEWL
ncbi:hypothetical protein D3C71_1682120 [compost metagenome]